MRIGHLALALTVIAVLVTPVLAAQTILGINLQGPMFEQGFTILVAIMFLYGYYKEWQKSTGDAIMTAITMFTIAAYAFMKGAFSNMDSALSIMFTIGIMKALIEKSANKEGAGTQYKTLYTTVVPIVTGYFMVTMVVDYKWSFITATMVSLVGTGLVTKIMEPKEKKDEGTAGSSEKNFVTAQIDKVKPKVSAIDAKKVLSNYTDLRKNIYYVSRYEYILRALAQIATINNGENKPRNCFFLRPLEPLPATLTPHATTLTQHPITTNDPVILSAISNYLDTPIDIRAVFAANQQHELYVPGEDTKHLNRMAGLLKDIKEELLAVDKEFRQRIFKSGEVPSAELLTEKVIKDRNGAYIPVNVIEDLGDAYERVINGVADKGVSDEHTKGYFGVGKGAMNTLLSTQDSYNRTLKKLKDKIKTVSDLMEELVETMNRVERKVNADEKTNFIFYRLIDLKAKGIIILYRSHPPQQPPVRIVLGNYEVPSLRKLANPDTGILDPLNTLKNRLEEAKLV